VYWARSACRDAQRRPQAVLPVAVGVQALLRGVTQVLARRRPGARHRRVAAQHAEFGQQLARGAGLAWRQRQVVGAERVGRHLVAAGAGIAARLALHFQQQEVVAARARQLPRRRQAADAAAGDGHGGPGAFRSAPESRVCRRRWPSASSAPESVPGGRGGAALGLRRRRGSAAADVAARKSRRRMDQCACTRPHSRSKMRTRFWLSRRLGSAAESRAMSAGKWNSAGSASGVRKRVATGMRRGRPVVAPAGEDEAPFAEAGHQRVVGRGLPAGRFEGGDHGPEALPRVHRRGGLDHDAGRFRRRAASAGGRRRSSRACPGCGWRDRGNRRRRSRTPPAFVPAIAGRRH
jgi:hypothetical protein